jgi:hypothetical protein
VPVPDAPLGRALDQLRASRFADLKGARVSLSIPISQRLLNEIVAAAIPPSAPVRDLTVTPRPSNLLEVRARVSKFDFLPPIKVTVEIEQQPRLPDIPLSLRLRSFPGLTAIAGTLLSPASLPRGVRLEGEHVLVDVRQLIEHAGYGDLVPLIERLHVGTDEGRLILHVDARVS